MAGKESSGIGAAEPDLFKGRTYILTPGDPAAMDFPQAKMLQNWIKKIGARPLILSPEQHDQAVAFVSHLPQLASTALAAALGNHSEEQVFTQTAGPGLLDTTRLALSPFDIWNGHTGY